jgi:hypothetical protein
MDRILMPQKMNSLMLPFGNTYVLKTRSSLLCAITNAPQVIMSVLLWVPLQPRNVMVFGHGETCTLATSLPYTKWNCRQISTITSFYKTMMLKEKLKKERNIQRNKNKQTQVIKHAKFYAIVLVSFKNLYVSLIVCIVIGFIQVCLYVIFYTM